MDIPAQHTTLTPEIRERAFGVAQKYCSPQFMKHLLAAECAMQGLARHLGGDPLTWGVAGLLHDVDWEAVEKNPELHCGEKTREICAEVEGLPEEIVETVISHYGLRGIPLDTLMKRGLFAIEELTGLIAATAKMNPNGLKAVEMRSVKKKFKDKTFAAGVDRDVILTCETNLNIPLEEFIGITLRAMQECGEDLV